MPQTLKKFTEKKYPGVKYRSEPPMRVELAVRDTSAMKRYEVLFDRSSRIPSGYLVQVSDGGKEMALTLDSKFRVRFGRDDTQKPARIAGSQEDLAAIVQGFGRFLPAMQEYLRREPEFAGMHPYFNQAVENLQNPTVRFYLSQTNPSTTT